MLFIDSVANGGKWVWGTLLAFAAAAVASAMLLTSTAALRYERDVNRMVFNDNLTVLQEVKGKLGETVDSPRAWRQWSRLCRLTSRTSS
jgi:Na+(H+)/acetate symporter ActP